MFLTAVLKTYLLPSLSFSNSIWRKMWNQILCGLGQGLTSPDLEQSGITVAFLQGVRHEVEREFLETPVVQILAVHWRA